MFLKTLNCGAVLACGVLALACASASADDKDKPGPSGVWVQNEGETKVEFADKDVMKIFPHGENKVIIIVCQYTAGKKGLVKAKITQLEGEFKEKVEKILPVGLEFSFKWTVKDDAGTLEEVTGEKVETLKSRLEGKYDQKK